MRTIAAALGAALILIALDLPIIGLLMALLIILGKHESISGDFHDET